MNGTIEIHEPKVEEVMPESIPVAVPPRPSRVRQLPVPQRAIFSDSLLEFGVQRKRHVMATVSSFLFNSLIIGILIVLPLYFTEELPKAQLLTFLVAPPPPPPPPPPAAAEQVPKVVRQIQTDMLANGGLRTPSRIPKKVQMISEEDAPPPMPVASGGVVGGVPGGVPGGQMGGVIGGIVNATSHYNAPKLTPVAVQRVRISQGVTKGLLVYRAELEYPKIARAARIQGNVVLQAIINRDGAIQDLQVVSGHPMLVPAAIASVKLWRYKPYLLNGQPVEVETTINVIFSISQ